MTTKENLEINEEAPSNILNAPKLKFKKPTICPPPFTLNDSYSQEEIDTENEDNSFDEKELKEFQKFRNEIKTNINTFTLKIKTTLKK